MLLSQLQKITLNNNQSFAAEDLRSQAKRVVNIILNNNKLSNCIIKKLLNLKKDILKNSEIDRLRTGSDVSYWNKIIFPKKIFIGLMIIIMV